MRRLGYSAPRCDSNGHSQGRATHESRETQCFGVRRAVRGRACRCTRRLAGTGRDDPRGEQQLERPGDLQGRHDLCARRPRRLQWPRRHQQVGNGSIRGRACGSCGGGSRTGCSSTRRTCRVCLEQQLERTGDVQGRYDLPARRARRLQRPRRHQQVGGGARGTVRASSSGCGSRTGCTGCTGRSAGGSGGQSGRFGARGAGRSRRRTRHGVGQHLEQGVPLPG